MTTAVEFGTKYHSCSEAMEWRRSLPAGATQADAWQACERGDWLLWQLSRGLTSEQYEAQRPAIGRALDRMVERAILVAHHAMADADIECPAWEVWALEWVSGEDRTERAAWAAWAAGDAWAAWAAAAAAGDALTGAWAAGDAWVAAWAAGAAARAAASDAAWAAAAAAGDALTGAWAAGDAARVAARAAAWDAEICMQAGDIRAEIPTWPGTED